MRKCHEAEIMTTRFISPIFPGITDVLDIIEKIKCCCDYIWVENFNLNGGFKKTIIDYIHSHRPELDELFSSIYSKSA